MWELKRVLRGTYTISYLFSCSFLGVNDIRENDMISMSVKILSFPDSWGSSPVEPFKTESVSVKV